MDYEQELQTMDLTEMASVLIDVRKSCARMKKLGRWVARLGLVLVMFGLALKSFQIGIELPLINTPIFLGVICFWFDQGSDVSALGVDEKAAAKIGMSFDMFRDARALREDELERLVSDLSRSRAERSELEAATTLPAPDVAPLDPAAIEASRRARSL